jgi:hypothetical protein
MRLRKQCRTKHSRRITKLANHKVTLLQSAWKNIPLKGLAHTINISLA